MMMMMMIDIIKRMPVPSSVMYMDWDEDNDKGKAITGYEFIKILIHSSALLPLLLYYSLTALNQKDIYFVHR